jgi:hypothetical protein
LARHAKDVVRKLQGGEGGRDFPLAIRGYCDNLVHVQNLLSQKPGEAKQVKVARNTEELLQLLGFDPRSTSYTNLLSFLSHPIKVERGINPES